MIKRTIFNDLYQHLADPEITVLIGPRQVGKTYLMQVLQNQLAGRGEKTVFLSLDVEEHKQFFLSQNALINYLRLQAGDSKAYVFIDEIQRKENAGLFLKGIYDMQLPYKFIVSGSGSLDLKARIKESMAGRKQLFVIEPVNFEEFVNFKTGYKYEDRLQDFFAVETIKTHSLLDEYLMFGGYPRVILAETLDKKKKEIEEIYVSYRERDITDLLGVEKPEVFTNLLQIIASQIGSLVNFSELSATVGLSNKTTQNYLWYLEQTFIIKKVTPYYRNVRSEISKAPIYYFYDTGLRNYLLGLFGLPSIPPVLSGHLFENAIFNMLRSSLPFASTSIHFWRTRDNAEVDFVLVKGMNVVPIEVKFSKFKELQISRSYRSFLTKYKPDEGFIVNLAGEGKTKVGTTTVNFIPYYQLIELVSDRI